MVPAAGAALYSANNNKTGPRMVGKRRRRRRISFTQRGAFGLSCTSTIRPNCWLFSCWFLFFFLSTFLYNTRWILNFVLEGRNNATDRQMQTLSRQYIYKRYRKKRRRFHPCPKNKTHKKMFSPDFFSFFVWIYSKFFFFYFSFLVCVLILIVNMIQIQQTQKTVNFSTLQLFIYIVVYNKYSNNSSFFP